MNNILEKYYPYVYYNDVKLSDIIKNLPSDINYFIVANYRYILSPQMVFIKYIRKHSNHFRVFSSTAIYMTFDEFNRDISILEREAKLKEFFELID